MMSDPTDGSETRGRVRRKHMEGNLAREAAADQRAKGNDEVADAIEAYADLAERGESF